jgi:SAM-dependent methyltransferase
MQPEYREDLAYVHDAGFGGLARAASAAVADALGRAGIDSGLVVELGCGSGISSRILRDRGFDVLGIDGSKAFLDIACRRVTDGDFRVGSILSADIPPCVAVTAIGEVVNYACSMDDGQAGLLRLLHRIHTALLPGGLLVFDIAVPARAPVTGSQRMWSEGDDWAVLVESEASGDGLLLTRRITTFREVEHLYRRQQETHRLRLLETDEVERWLTEAGFSVFPFDYNAQPLPVGLVAYKATRPAVPVPVVAR